MLLARYHGHQGRDEETLGSGVSRAQCPASEPWMPERPSGLSGPRPEFLTSVQLCSLRGEQA